MTPNQYVNEIVLPTLREARDARLDRRRSYLAAIVTHHTADYLTQHGEKKVRDRISATAGIHWQVVRSVTNGAKHVEADPQKHTIDFTSGTDTIRPPCFAGIAIAGLSILGDTTGAIEIPGADGVTYDLYGSSRFVVQKLIESFPASLDSCDAGDL